MPRAREEMYAEVDGCFTPTGSSILGALMMDAVQRGVPIEQLRAAVATAVELIELLAGPVSAATATVAGATAPTPSS